jgi:ubiquinone/menaquinone biosynthesis C-methylase UbiE
MKRKKSFEEALEDNPLRPLVRYCFEIRPLWKAARLGHVPEALHVACLRGDSTMQLMRRFDIGRMVAVDKSEALVTQAKEKHRDPAVEFGVMDIPALGFTDGRFDAVFNLAELHNYADWRRGLAEMARVLKPGGTLVMNDLCAESFERGMGPYYKKRTAHPYEAMLTEAELREELPRAGLKTIVFESRAPFGFIRYLVVVARKAG